jgi:hypothetical protein
MPDIEWVPFYRGHRIYNRQAGDRWIWNYDFKRHAGRDVPDGSGAHAGAVPDRAVEGPLVIIEPNLPAFKTSSANKEWPRERYGHVAKELKTRGYDVAQFAHGGKVVLSHARQIATPNFRTALAVLERARSTSDPKAVCITGAAAVSVGAVVLFGGFIPPSVTGYAAHTNLTGGASACGSLKPCAHCRAAMEAISVEEVVDAAEVHLARRMA